MQFLCVGTEIEIPLVMANEYGIEECSWLRGSALYEFNKNLEKVLFCIRAKEPYKGLYNFVGGKVEEGESNEHEVDLVEEKNK